MRVGVGRLPPANPMQVAEDDPLEVGNDDQTQVAEADPGPVMPNLDILLLTFILLLFLHVCFTSTLCQGVLSCEEVCARATLAECPPLRGERASRASFTFELTIHCLRNEFRGLRCSGNAHSASKLRFGEFGREFCLESSSGNAPYGSRARAGFGSRA